MENVDYIRSTAEGTKKKKTNHTTLLARVVGATTVQVALVSEIVFVSYSSRS